MNNCGLNVIPTGCTYVLCEQNVYIDTCFVSKNTHAYFYIYIYYHLLILKTKGAPEYIFLTVQLYIYMGLRQNSGMDRPAVIRRYGSACGFRAVHFDSQPYVCKT